MKLRTIIFIFFTLLFISGCEFSQDNDKNNTNNQIDDKIDTVSSLTITGYKDFLEKKYSFKKHKNIKYLSFNTPDSILPTDSILLLINNYKSIELLAFTCPKFRFPDSCIHNKTIKEIVIYTDTMILNHCSFLVYDSLYKIMIMTGQGKFSEDIVMSDRVREIAISGKFHSLPSFLFGIENLEYLTVFSDEMLDISISIHKMKKLKTLNISNTKFGQQLLAKDDGAKQNLKKIQSLIPACTIVYETNMPQ